MKTLEMSLLPIALILATVMLAVGGGPSAASARASAQRLASGSTAHLPADARLSLDAPATPAAPAPPSPVAPAQATAVARCGGDAALAAARRPAPSVQASSRS
jgi:hypothetical protein